MGVHGALLTIIYLRMDKIYTNSFEYTKLGPITYDNRIPMFPFTLNMDKVNICKNGVLRNNHLSNIGFFAIRDEDDGSITANFKNEIKCENDAMQEQGMQMYYISFDDESFSSLSYADTSSVEFVLNQVELCKSFTHDPVAYFSFANPLKRDH